MANNDIKKKKEPEIVQEETLPEESTPEVQESPTSDFMTNPDVIAYIDKKIAEGVQTALRGKTPKANTTDPSNAEKSEFDRMTYRERLQLFQSNPQAYQKLKGGH